MRPPEAASDPRCGGTYEVCMSYRKPPHLLEVGAENSHEHGPVRLRQDAKRGHSGGGDKIGEIEPQPPIPVSVLDI
jgi:hypothetical protein